jgi:hypothetical protein
MVNKNKLGYFLRFNIDKNVISFIVAQGNCAVEDSDCYWVVKRGATANLYGGARNKPHLAQAPTKFTGNIDRHDDAVLVLAHLP